jgi:N-methylhydantoinase A
MWHVGVDVGGTFTDLVAVNRAGGQPVHLKVSTVSGDPAAGFMEAIKALRLRAGVGPGEIESIFHGTTLVTNAIIERNLAKTALVTTRGFRDILEIGRHWRSDLYDPEFEPPPTLVGRVLRFEVDERIDADGTVVTALADAEIERIVAELNAAGVQAVGVALLHAHSNPEHEEKLIGRLRQAAGDSLYLCGSSELSREPREFERTATTLLNAALMKLVDDYLTRLQRSLAAEQEVARLYITHSNGGALSPDSARKRPVALAQSGPVAGVQSCLQLGQKLGYKNLIGFDIGGTSTDIALIENGQPRLANEIDVGGLPVRLPTVQVYSIGAGGGSIAAVDEVGSLQVGPESAGAMPGPACYGRGGERPTVTDAHVVLGRLPTSRKLAGFLKLDAAAATRAVQARIGTPLNLSLDQAAQAIIDVINAKMEGAVRVLLRERGSDPRDFALVAFGGAGPLHAIELASRLGIGTVIVPRHPGTFSAFGLLTSDLRHDFALSRPIRSDDPDAATKLVASFEALEELIRQQLSDDADFSGEVHRARRCDLRYLGQAYDVGVPLAIEPDDPAAWEQLGRAFHDEHERAYAFADRSEPYEIRTHRLALTVKVGSRYGLGASDVFAPGLQQSCEILIAGQRIVCPLLDRDALHPGDIVSTPCLIVQEDATTFVPPGGSVTIAETGDLIVTGISAL